MSSDIKLIYTDNFADAYIGKSLRRAIISPVFSMALSRIYLPILSARIQFFTNRIEITRRVLWIKKKRFILNKSDIDEVADFGSVHSIFFQTGPGVIRIIHHNSSVPSIVLVGATDDSEHGNPLKVLKDAGYKVKY